MKLKIKNIYILYSSLSLLVLSSIFMMFFIQFKIMKLQNISSEIDSIISRLEDNISVLKVEWVYLTRPKRLRILSEKYLKNGRNASLSNIKNIDEMRIIYKAKLKESGADIIAMNNLNK